MITKTKIAGLMVALMALSAPMVYADGGDWHHGQKDHFLAKVLNLSDDQVKQIQDSRQKQKEAMKNIFEQIKTNRESLNAEITKATPDMNKINSISTQIKTLLSQMVDNRLNAIMDLKKIMTPEQFAGYMALEKAKKMMMHHDGHGHWGDKSDKDHDSDDQD